jgi:ribose 5-phosphate isomerase B
VDIAKGSRQHNNANILCLAGRHTSMTLSEKILKAFLTTEFEGGRHQRRVDKLNC